MDPSTGGAARVTGRRRAGAPRGPRHATHRAVSEATRASPDAANRPALFDLAALPVPTPPTFCDRVFDVAHFGAMADDATDNADAFARAIAACAEAGGGRVSVPAGRWRVGPIQLIAGVELHLDDHATLCRVASNA